MVLTVGKITRIESWFGPLFFSDGKFPEKKIKLDSFYQRKPQMINTDVDYFVVDEFGDFVYGSLIPKCWKCKCKRMNLYSCCLAMTEISIKTVELDNQIEFSKPTLMQLHELSFGVLFNYGIKSFEVFLDGSCVRYDVVDEFLNSGNLQSFH